MDNVVYGSGTQDDPWIVKTPPQTSEFQVWKDEAQDPPALVVQVGKTRLSYQHRAVATWTTRAGGSGSSNIQTWNSEVWGGGFTIPG
ncbi:MAG: DUF6855 family protein, partial [Pseudomonadota bacterium]